MSRLKFMRVVYLMPLLLLGLWPVPIVCQQCGERVGVESVFARVASDWEDNFFCGFGCADQYLKEHPIYRALDGTIERRH